MTFSLDDMAELVRTIARQRRVKAEVVGVTPAEGDGRYVEVIVDLEDSDQRVAVGLDRDSTRTELRERIEGRLDDAARSRGALS